MSKYISDKSYFKRPRDGRFIRGGNPEIEVGKSYTFDIKPRYDVEKEVKLIIFIIPDLQEAVNNGILSVSDASSISYAGLIPDTNNPGQFRSPDLSGQAIAYVELINLPIVNPKNGSNLESYLDGELEEKFISFNPSGLKQHQVIWPGETNYRTSSGNKINTIDEYINEILITAQNIYKFNIYQIKKDLNLINLPDNKVEFTQEFLSEEETTNIDESSEPVVEEAIILNDITFKIDQDGDITNDKLGYLKIINKIADSLSSGFDFGDDEQDLSLLDDEFIESDFQGESDEAIIELLEKDLTKPDPDSAGSDSGSTGGGEIDKSKESSASALKGKVKVQVGNVTMNASASDPMNADNAKKQTEHWTHRPKKYSDSSWNSNQDWPVSGGKQTIIRDGKQYGHLINENGRMVPYANASGWLSWFSGYKDQNGKSVQDNSEGKNYYVAYDVSIFINGNSQPVEIIAPFDCEVAGVQSKWGDVALKGIGQHTGKVANFTHCTGPKYNKNNTNINPSNGVNSGFDKDFTNAIKKGKTFKKGDKMGIFQGNVAPAGLSNGVHLHIDLMSKKDFDQYIKDILSQGWYD